MNKMLVGLVWLVLIAFSHESLAVRFYGLDDLPGGDIFSRAEAVSGDGTTVVGYSVSADGPEAIRWTIQEGIMGLGDLPGGAFSSAALDVSFDGSVIVGQATTSTSIPTTSDGSTAFRWANGTMTNLFGLTIWAHADGVSADGNIVVGTRKTATNEPSRAFSTGYNIGPWIDGRVFESATAVSGDGTTVIGYSNYLDSALHPEAVIWTPVPGGGPRGILNGLGGLLPNSFSKADAISADGTTIVGQAGGPLGDEAVIFRPGPVRGLGDLPGGSFESYAHGVSGDGSVVVGESKSALGAEAFIWTATGGMRNLQVYLSSFDVDLAGWQLTSALDISDDGRVIVGVGQNFAGYTEGWIAIVPEPTSALLLVLAAGGACSQRRRS